MLIIIFAVWFAVFMERRREHHHEQKEVKEFLTGLRTDLVNDIREMKEDRFGYVILGKGFSYFSGSYRFHPDSVNKNSANIGHSIHLLVNSGRYEGFKTSGKINLIGNTQLRNSILDLYQETLVGLTNSTKFYNEIKQQFFSLLFKGLIWEKELSDTNFSRLIQGVELRNYCKQLRYTGEVIRRYDSAIYQSQRIIELVNQEYGKE
ncbi:MAG: hypothetical protein IPG86_01785 [Chitinophagaceae bacterium]|nr:hypothetical protein [Chitinophagaceae bacterium]